VIVEVEEEDYSYPEDEGSKSLRNVGNYKPIDMSSHYKKLEC
jgi:hypothetical protein